MFLNKFLLKTINNSNTEKLNCVKKSVKRLFNTSLIKTI